ncbi:MAG: DUF4397 domain-containing protein, partial [Pseudomonadota bacterium]
MNFSSRFPVSIGRLKLLCIGLAIASLSALLGGCGKNSSGTEDGEIRVINLTAESGSLNIVVGDETTNWQSAIAAGTTTAFKTIGSGSKRLRVSNAGGVIVDGSINVLSKQKQLLIVSGGASSVGMILLNNDIATGASGKTKIRLNNYAVGLGAYDVYATTASEDYLTVEPKV